MPDISTVAEESDSLLRSWYFRDGEIRTEIDTFDEPRAMQGISGGWGISPWSDLDVLTLDLVDPRLDIDQLVLPRCYQSTPYQEHPGAPSVSPNPRVFVRIGPLGSAQVVPGDNS